MLDLEGTGKLVYYATPDFWTKRKLDEHFTNGRVHDRYGVFSFVLRCNFGLVHYLVAARLNLDDFIP
jgi:hypothetical protein